MLSICSVSSFMDEKTLKSNRGNTSMCIDSNMHTESTHVLMVLVTAGVRNGTSIFRDPGKGNTRRDRGHSCRPLKHIQPKQHEN